MTATNGPVVMAQTVVGWAMVGGQRRRVELIRVAEESEESWELRQATLQAGKVPGKPSGRDGRTLADCGVASRLLDHLDDREPPETRHVDPVGDEEMRRVAEDALEYGVGYLVDGKRVAPQVVRAFVVEDRDNDRTRRLREISGQ